MPTIFWIAIGGFGLSVLLLISREFSSGIAIFIVTGLVCALYEKLEQWGLVTTTYTTKPRQTKEPRIAHVISKSLEPRRPDLPPPIRPETSAGPVKGLMRVDVTQTPQSVDVFITLSEQAHFLVNNNHLGSVPIEQNYDGMAEHMANFKRQLTSAYDETDANVAGRLSGNALESWKENTAQWRAEDKARQPQELSDEQQRYKERNTVYLRDYLQNPYRKIVENPLQASQYMKRLENEYLPKIKATLDGAAPSQTKSYEF